MSRFVYFCTDHHIEFVSSPSQKNHLIFRTFDLAPTANQAGDLGLDRLINSLPRFLLLFRFITTAPGISKEKPVLVKKGDKWVRY